MNRRDAWWATAGVVAFGVSLAGDPYERGAAAAEEAARAQLLELGKIAGLRDATGRANDLRPLTVNVMQDGGPMWLSARVAAAVQSDGRFELDETSWDAVAEPVPVASVRAELVGAVDAFDLKLSLWRRGWAVAPPRPTRRRVVPWALVLGLAGGAGLVRRSRVLAVAISALGLQLLSFFVAWPASLLGAAAMDAWSHGPLVSSVLHVARTLSDTSVAVASGLVVACVVLAAFDHRRSRIVGTSLSGSAAFRILLRLMFALGSTFVGLEAALRLGLIPWIAGGWGMAGIVAVPLVTRGVMGVGRISRG